MVSLGSVGSGVSDGSAKSEGPVESVGSFGYVRFMRSEGPVGSVGSVGSSWTLGVCQFRENSFFHD